MCFEVQTRTANAENRECGQCRSNRITSEAFLRDTAILIYDTSRTSQIIVQVSTATAKTPPNAMTNSPSKKAVRGYLEIKCLKTRGFRQPGNSVCIKTPVFLKIPKTENTKIPGFQALYLQIASKNAVTKKQKHGKQYQGTTVPQNWNSQQPHDVFSQIEEKSKGLVRVLVKRKEESSSVYPSGAIKYATYCFYVEGLDFYGGGFIFIEAIWKLDARKQGMVRPTDDAVCLKTPGFPKIPKIENTKIPGFQARYLQTAS